jgi:hypothetical protein
MLAAASLSGYRSVEFTRAFETCSAKIRPCHDKAKMFVLSCEGAPSGAHGFAAMPSLIRVLVVVSVVLGLAYGAMFALATLVDPRPREMTVTVPPDRFVKQQR